MPPTCYRSWGALPAAMQPWSPKVSVLGTPWMPAATCMEGMCGTMHRVSGSNLGGLLDVCSTVIAMPAPDGAAPVRCLLQAFTAWC